MTKQGARSADRAPGAEKARGASPEQERIATVLRALLRTERTFRTFSPDDPVCGRVLARLQPQLDALLPLDLQVRPDQLVCKGHALLDPAGPSDLPARLYRDGIRRLILEAGLTPEELASFLRAVSTRLTPGDPSQDYVTLLWEADLAHVKVVSIDPILDLDVPDEVLDGELVPAQELEPQAGAAPGAEIPVPPADAFRVTAEDRATIAAALAATEQDPPWHSFVDALLENLARPQRRERVEQITRLLEKTFERLLLDARFEDAARLLGGLLRSLPIPAQFPVRQMQERLAHPDRLARIAAAVEGGTCTEDQAETLFLGFGDWAAESLCALLSRQAGEHLRRIYVDALVKIGTGALDPVMAHLLHAEPATRRYFARVLARIKDEGAREALVSCLDSDDATLRAEAVVGLSVQADDAIRERFRGLALADGDTSVRIAALRAVIEERAGVDCARVVQRLEAADLKMLGDEEKDLLFQALGAGGGAEALEFLGRSLKARWMVGRAEQETWRRAAMALVAMGTPQALGVLRANASGRGKLATVCQEALRHATVRKT